MRTAIAALACTLAASLAFATGAITDDVRDTLSQIDAIPTKTQLDDVLGTDAKTGLSTIAKDLDEDTGVRVRAIHGLGKYCASPCDETDVVHASLTTLISETRNETLGEPVVLLRAAIETLGSLRVKDDAALLTGLLDHPSRDIRAATARALRDLCNNQASTALRVRYTAEPTEQVKLAISEALRILQQCGQ